MKSVLKILGIVGKVILYILVVSGSLLSLATAYIVLAPDDLPKPYRLSYLYPTPTPEVLETPTPTPSPEEIEEPILPGQGVMIDTGTKIINLAEPGGRKYIRINVVVEFAPPEVEETGKKAEAAPAEGEAAAAEDPAVTALTNEVNARLPMINDTVITLLSSKTFQDLYTSTGKEALRGELMQKLQAMMPDFEIIGVYFTEFVVE